MFFHLHVSLIELVEYPQRITSFDFHVVGYHNYPLSIIIQKESFKGTKKTTCETIRLLEVYNSRSLSL